MWFSSYIFESHPVCAAFLAVNCSLRFWYIKILSLWGGKTRSCRVVVGHCLFALQTFALSATSVLTGSIGAKLGQKIDTAKLQKVFAAFLVLVKHTDIS